MIGNWKPQKKKHDWRKQQIEPADLIFSEGIRIRDYRCVWPGCGRQGELNAKGYRIKLLECSHYFRRGHEATRFDPKNCDTFCHFHHRMVHSNGGRPKYDAFKKRQLGEQGFQELTLKANAIHKKRRGEDLVRAREFYNEMAAKRPPEKVNESGEYSV